MFLILIIITLSACNSKGEDDISAFFSWMDGYVAMPVSTEFSLALTYFYKDNTHNIRKDDVGALSFVDIESAIEITDFKILVNDGHDDGIFDSYVFLITLTAHEKGVFETSRLRIDKNNEQESVSFPIGQWVFDIGDDESGDEYIETIGSHAVSSNSQEFVYDYEQTAPEVIITKIWLGKNIWVQDKNGLPPTGRIPFPEGNAAPIYYVKPKLELNIDGKQVIAYGFGLYAGAMNFEKEDLLLSIEFAKENGGMITVPSK